MLIYNIMGLMKTFKKLCTPAMIYLVISLFALIIVTMQNFDNTTKLCVGKYSCIVPNVTLVLLFNLLYILFWTWILSLICNAGYKIISWILVLLPFIVAFVYVFLFGVDDEYLGNDM